ncbi:hypothetical protein [Halorarius litoreus]|uniref:hypothetical protein n=1 Tax=Halorarius litoreus TaxID=2962676 RepID=UPI0020CEEB91|nr:hypothetical protein [Halorarius litoreus]
MQIDCPRCASALDVDVPHEVRTDGGHGNTDVGLWGIEQLCGACGWQFDVYIY